jgi:hypothetical protein
LDTVLDTIIDQLW